MNSNELRKKFIDFFVEKGHKEVPAASLIPENDPSVLFTTAGMQQLVPYLLGEKHPLGDKLVDIQPCVRTDDINEVGDESHNTYFEMLGFWSLGAYWKREAIQYTFDFYTKELGIDISQLGITCFEGDTENGIPKDTESAEIWKSLGILENRIKFLGYKDNFWGPSGEEGPCGPDTEIFVWTGEESIPQTYDNSDKRWVEIGNDVFMEYRKVNGKYEKLEQKNVDFGGGFERILTYLENKKSVFETDLFESIIELLENELPLKKEKDIEYLRIIADHLRASAMIINVGVEPSNKGQGYILRRLIRRTLLHSQWAEQDFDWLKKAIDTISKIYPELVPNKEKIKEIIVREAKKFQQTLERGKKEIEKLNEINGQTAFNLYQTYGFPFELTKEYAALKNIKIDSEEFNQELEKHRDLSRTASAGMFKGGLASGGEMETKYHTATHLLLKALQQVLGQDVHQRGSNINSERLRFDFSYPEKLTAEQIKKIEDIINEKIKADLEVSCEEMNLQDAKKLGAEAQFVNKYGEKVRVYKISDFSCEVCGGPHVEKTGVLGHFKIIKEESSSSGIRRIKAILK